MLNYFFKFNRQICNLFDAALPKSFTIDGYNDYSNKIVPRFLNKNLVVYDIGGGKQPHFSSSEKERFKLNITGIILIL